MVKEDIATCILNRLLLEKRMEECTKNEKGVDKLHCELTCRNYKNQCCIYQRKKEGIIQFLKKNKKLFYGTYEERSVYLE